MKSYANNFGENYIMRKETVLKQKDFSVSGNQLKNMK